MNDLRDRVVVITGASGNLGVAIAKAFHAAGAKLVLCDRSPEHVASALGEVAHGHIVSAADVTDEAVMTKVLADARAKLGEIDGLVCTVGGYVGGSPVADTDWSIWEKMLALNLKSGVACARATLPHLKERGGTMVFVASLAALAGSAGESAYAGSKAALLRFIESFAAETKSFGIRVNAVLPGTIDTPQNRAWMSAEQANVAIAPGAIADVVAF